MSVLIREAETGDLPELLRLYTMLHDNPVPEESDKLEELWGAIINDRNHHIIVAEEDGKLVSSCVCIVIPNLTREQRPYALIENVVTDEAYRGKGYATACLDYARELARKENCYKLMLMTGSKSEATLRFYENAGYNKNDKTAFIQWI